VSVIDTTERRPLTPAPTFTVHEKQREVIKSDARYKVLEWGRRGGKNIIACIERIEYLRKPWEYDWGRDNPANGTTWWVGPSYDQANKYGFDKLESAVPDEWIEYRKYTKPRELGFVNGWTVEFRTFDKPETLQGAGVDDMVIDEADYMPNSLWYDDLEPMLMDNSGRAMFISKPVRPRSYFRKLADRGKSSNWSDNFYSHATSADNPFIDEDPMDKRGTMPEAKFKQQYLAELVDDGASVFKKLDERLFTGEYSMRGELTGSGHNVTGEVWRPVAQCTPPYVVAADFARSQDFRVTGALDASGQLCYLSRSQNEGWDTIFEDLKRAANDYPGVLVPDASRDNKIVSDLAAEGINVKPTKFSPKKKRNMYDNLITRVENSELTLPDIDAMDQVYIEMAEMERDVTPSGYTRYNAPSDGYDDCVDMLALAASQLDNVIRARRNRESEARQEADTGVSGI